MELDLEFLDKALNKHAELAVALVSQINKLTERIATLETRLDERRVVSADRYRQQRSSSKKEPWGEVQGNVTVPPTDGDTVEISTALFEALRRKKASSDASGIVTITIPLAEYNELKRAEGVMSALAAFESFVAESSWSIGLTLDILGRVDDQLTIDIDIIKGDGDVIVGRVAVFDSAADAIVEVVGDLDEYDITDDGKIILREADL